MMVVEKEKVRNNLSNNIKKEYMKKVIFALLSLFSLNAFAISIPVTEGMVNFKVSSFFPKTVRKIELSNPQCSKRRNWFLH